MTDGGGQKTDGCVQTTEIRIQRTDDGNRTRLRSLSFAFSFRIRSLGFAFGYAPTGRATPRQAWESRKKG
jgi:hypothetical protein